MSPEIINMPPKSLRCLQVMFYPGLQSAGSERTADVGIIAGKHGKTSQAPDCHLHRLIEPQN